MSLTEKGVNDAIGVIGFNINVQLNNMGNTDIQAKRTELVLRDSAGTVSAKPELNYFNLADYNFQSCGDADQHTISVPKASDWSHAVSFIRPIGTSVKAEFQLVRQVVIDSILE